MARRAAGAILLLLGAPVIEAVRLPAWESGLPTVLGTKMLSDQEMKGNQPIFVDAFPSVDGGDMHIVLNFSPMFPRGYPALNHTAWDISIRKWRHWTKAAWQCQWAAGNIRKGRHASGNNFSISSAKVLHSTFNESETSAGVSADMFLTIHHALVLSCPIPRQLVGSNKKATFSISASGGGVTVDEPVRYKRARIPVAKGAFVRPGTGSVLCTMLFKEDQIDKTLPPWVRYHLALGIDQILLYVEDADTKWASQAIADLPGAGKVTVVPFYFGKVSEQRAFHMQAGMENHCLFQARGRAEWLANADIDEYFEVKALPGQSIKDYLSKVPRSTGTVEVQSQFWADTTEPDDRDWPFPCYITCKQPGYFPQETRSKWWARPTEINIYSPHCIRTIGSAERYLAPPESLRLNHYKECRPDMDAYTKTLNRHGQCWQTDTCELDSSFLDVCKRVLGK